MDYKAYAPHFDPLCAINPAYEELLDLFALKLAAMDLPHDPDVVDLGAGTGNFVCALLDRIPNARVSHVDCSPDMNKIAAEKYAQRKLKVDIVEGYMQTVKIPPQSKDLVICVNALNNAPPVRPTLNRIYSWLKPGGYFFLVDFGREIDVVDWTWFLFKHLLSEYGVRETISVIRRQSKVISINRKGRNDQLHGALWTHTTVELLEYLHDAGFKNAESKLCYRDYADMVVTQRLE